MNLPAGKKLPTLVVLAVVAASAVLFSKRSSEPENTGDALTLPPHRETLARRLPSPSGSPDAVQHRLWPSDEPGPKMPTVSTPGIDPRAGSSFAANYQRAFSPAGAMLESNGDEPAAALPTGDDGPELDAAANPPRTHKVVDGDTLIRLAAQYLGSSDRYLEIFAANRRLLKNPDLLPIGAVIVIPPAQPGQGSSGQGSSGQAPLEPSAGKEHGLRAVPLAPIPSDDATGTPPFGAQ